MKHILAIGGNDPSGGAGITVDLKTIKDFDCFGFHALSAVVAQSTDGVRRWDGLPLLDQLEALFETVRVDAVKIGMLGTAENLRVTLQSIPEDLPIVLDPVMAATLGAASLESNVFSDLDNLVDRLRLITPNIDELSVLTQQRIADRQTAVQAGRTLAQRLQCAVLVKVGHLEHQESAIDVLVDSTDSVDLKSYPWLSVNARGTGCRLSSAIACEIAKGAALIDAVESARDYLHRKLVNSTYDLGSGNPVIL